MQTIYSDIDGLILYIGAGYGDDIADCLDASPQRLVLVEPDPEASAELVARLDGVTEASVLRSAVRDGPGPSFLRRYNFAQVNALRPPTGLTQIYPGLTEIEKTQVNIRSLVDIVQDLAPDPEARNLLIFEAPGEAVSSIGALARSGLLDRFAALRIVQSQSELYQNGGTLADLTDVLLAASFIQTGICTEDPAQPVVQFSINPLLNDLRAARAEAAALRAQLRAMETPQEAPPPETKAPDQIAALEALLDQRSREFDRLEGQVDVIRRFLTPEAVS